jgi:plasmid replication initiation protein
LKAVIDMPKAKIKKLQSVRDTDLIEKRNVLNQLCPNEMGLQEMRFFTIYLSKINARDITTRYVRFPVREFQQLMNLERADISNLAETADKLLRQIVNIPLESGGFEKFQLFNKCIVDRDKFGAWYIEINAHDDALPLMFDFKERYFTYQLRSVLYLKSVNQIRLYELLKENVHNGSVTFELGELKLKLGICRKNGAEHYSRWQSLKERVLEPCRKALEATDIRFTFSPVKSSRAVTAVEFLITCVGYKGETESSDDSFKTPASAQYSDVLTVYYGKAVMNDISEKLLVLLLKHLTELFTAEELPVETVEYEEADIADCDPRLYKVLHNAYMTYLQNKLKTNIKNPYGYIKKLCTQFTAEEAEGYRKQISLL